MITTTNIQQECVFIESLALWLNQFNSKNEKEAAVKFIQERLIFISNQEMNHLVKITYPDILRPLLTQNLSEDLNLKHYQLQKICSSPEFKIRERKSLFLGLSDGSRTDQFRRANPHLTNEQVYQSHELSLERAEKMQEKLFKELKNRDSSVQRLGCKYETIFLLDDFSASGNSYLRKEDGVFKGKIWSVYKNSMPGEVLDQLLDIKKAKVYVVLYLCTSQAMNQISTLLDELWDPGYPRPELIPVHLLDDMNILSPLSDEEVHSICQNSDYYDAEALEDEHTRVGGTDVKFGFADCKLPLVLSHNCPNNSISILWAYDTEGIKFFGLFPRVPRYKERL